MLLFLLLGLLLFVLLLFLLFVIGLLLLLFLILLLLLILVVVLVLLVLVVLLVLILFAFLVLILLGMFMGQISIMLLTVPIFFPLAISIGFDPIWFGLVMLLSLEISFTTPPFGLLLFVMKGVAPPGTTMKEIYLAAIPFIFCSLLVVVLLVMFPALATWLPSLN